MPNGAINLTQLIFKYVKAKLGAVQVSRGITSGTHGWLAGQYTGHCT